MFVYIAHAEKDQIAADELAAFLKARGLIAHSETGTKGFRHLQPSDVVVGLWSNNALFNTYRMQMERRLLDAWADGKLVLVRIDHGVPPVGLRDLQHIDASVEMGRQLSVWPSVERAAREAMNQALAAREKADGAHPPPQPARKRSGPAAKGGAATMEASFTPPSMGMMVLFAGLICMVGAIATLTTDIDPSPASRVVALLVLGCVLFVGLIAGIVLGIGAIARRGRSPAKAAAPAASATAPASGIFVSYAHADRPAVEPLVEEVKRMGRPVWIDKGGIQPGESWAGEIVRGIRSAKSVVVMCSPTAFESDHIKREVYLADRYKKPMLPIFLTDAKPPEDFEYFFAGVQWLELFKLPEADRPAAVVQAVALA